MIEIEVPKYTVDMLAWLRGHNIQYTYFSGRQVMAFVSDEDATAFMMTFGGKRSHFVEEMQQRFIEAAKQERFDRSRIR
jgi:hypothetical protein